VQRVAVVTGAGQGIGAATARLLGERGYAVALVGRTRAKLERIAGVVHAGGGEGLAVVADLEDPDAAGEIIRLALNAFGRLDVLVNNAAVISYQRAGELTAEEFDRIVAVNVRAPLLLVEAALPHLAASGNGAVVNVSSAAAVMYRPGQALYALSKAALEHSTYQFAVELAPHGIRVNAVRPGPTDTPIHRAHPAGAEERRVALAGSIPLGRLGRPEEVAWWIVALAEPAAAWVTGAVVSVDGGRILGSPAGA
jgi:NAD(P)-dependent dehydrogenase (short-subunit alcohol dehydrogenase family)